MTIEDTLRANRIRVPSTKLGHYYTTCPKCSELRAPRHRRLKCLGVTIEPDGVCWGCNHCGWKGGSHDDVGANRYSRLRGKKDKPGNRRSLQHIYR